MELQIIYILVGAIITIIYGVIGWFFKTMISELKIQLQEVRTMSVENKSKVDLVENNHLHLNNRFDLLYNAVVDLTKEIQKLNIAISKKKE